MPPADKPVLSHSILLALGLGACTGKVTACLLFDPETSETADTATTSPCLDYATETGTTSPCLTGSWPDTGTDTDSGLQTGTGDTGTTDTGATDTGATGTGATGSVQVRSRASVFEKIEASGVLPADVLERLKKRDL